MWEVDCARNMPFRECFWGSGINYDDSFAILDCFVEIPRVRFVFQFIFVVLNLGSSFLCLRCLTYGYEEKLPSTDISLLPDKIGIQDWSERQIPSSLRASAVFLSCFTLYTCRPSGAKCALP